MFGYVAINIDIGSLEHAFVVVQANNDEFLIYDSYVGHRSLGSQKFDFDLFRSLLSEPTLEKWNDMWKCEEKVMNDTDVFLQYGYVDISANGAMFMYDENDKLVKLF